MKKLFAIFCAVALSPIFSAQAWIGGPFSNNTFFGENGDDGVYEGIAIPTSGVSNGVGIFRWAVSNAGAVSTADLLTVSQVGSGNTPTINNFTPITSNSFFGGVSGTGHSWFINGVYYTGIANGTANSALNFVSAVSVAVNTGGTDSVSSGFTGGFVGSGDGIISRRFNGVGSGTVASSGLSFSFSVFGSQVSPGVSYNGVVVQRAVQ